MDREAINEASRLHENLDYIGLRAQATSVGLLQLCAELSAVGVLDDAAVGRIKTAIRDDIIVSRKRVHNRAEFENLLCDRLDALFSRPNCPQQRRVGTVSDMQSALRTTPPELAPEA